MEELKKAFYDVMYKYGKPFSEQGVMTNLNAWASAKEPLLKMLRLHPSWNEEAKAVVLEFKEGREIDRSVIDEVSYEMLEIAEELIPADRIEAFRTAFKAAVGECSRTLNEKTLVVIRNNANIRCVEGEKASRIIGKICKAFGLDKHSRYNHIFAQLSDALNPIDIKRTAVLSLHPCDFLEMSSTTNTWTSCHNLRDGGYKGGTLSYMTDRVSMVFFTVDPDVKERFYKAARRTRQMFFYKDNCLFQSKCYPKGSDDVDEPNRAVVHMILSECLEKPNLWVLKNNIRELNCCETVEGSTHYPDYNSYGNLSFFKGTENIPKIRIGSKPICVNCGRRFSNHSQIKCGCSEMVVCHNCGRTVQALMANYIGGFFQCKACLHICACCGEATSDRMYPAFDRRGRPIEVCLDCYRKSCEPCFACSVKTVCNIIGNSLCPRTALMSETEVM